MKALQGRTVLITGGSSGIGAATAVACGARGMNVVLVARRLDRLEAVASEVRRVGGAAQAVAADLAKADESERLVQTAIERFGALDVVFANAGYGTRSALLDMHETALREMFEVNLFSAISLCRAAAHRWVQFGQPGHLIMTSSCVGKFPLAYYGAYCATKASQSMMCGALRAELAPYRIAVSSVHPVTTTTEFFLESERRSGGCATSRAPDHAPRWLIQTPERVAKAVVRCMQKPQPEVWTSTLVRLAAGLFTASPWLLHRVLDHQAKIERRQGHAR